MKGKGSPHLSQAGKEIEYNLRLGLGKSSSGEVPPSFALPPWVTLHSGSRWYYFAHDALFYSLPVVLLQLRLLLVIVDLAHHQPHTPQTTQYSSLYTSGNSKTRRYHFK